mgnify:CR=1 FL=1
MQIRNVMLGEKAHMTLHSRVATVLQTSTGFLPYLSLTGPSTSVPMAMKMKKNVIVRLVMDVVVSKYVTISGRAGMYRSVARGGIIDRMVMRKIRPPFFNFRCFMFLLLDHR